MILRVIRTVCVRHLLFWTERSNKHYKHFESCKYFYHENESWPTCFEMLCVQLVLFNLINPLSSLISCLYIFSLFQLWKHVNSGTVVGLIINRWPFKPAVIQLYGHSYTYSCDELSIVI